MKAIVDTVDRRAGFQARIAFWLAFTACLIACGLASRVFAQANSPQLSGDYYVASMQDFADPAKVRELEGKVRLAISDASVTAGSDAFKAAELYYTQYFWRKMSQPDAASDLGELVASTLRSLDSMALTGSKALRASMLGWVRQSAINVATGKPEGKYFSPTARINAAVLLANLNAEPRSGNTPPRPDMVTSGPLRTLLIDAEAPLGVRVIALSGFRRHAILQGAAAADSAKAFYLGQAKAVLDDSGPVGMQRKDVSADVHAFLEIYGIDIVRAVGTADDQKWLANKLNEIVMNPEASPIAVSYAARQLTVLGEGVKSVEVTTPVLVAWAERASRTLQDELERLKNIDPPKVVVSQQILVQPKQPKGRGGAPGGGLGGMDDGGYPGGGYPSGPGGAGYPGGDEGGLGGGGLGPGGMGGLGPDDGYSGGGYPGGAGGYPGGGLGVAARPQPAEVLASRRILNSMLEALLLGLAGELDAMKPPKTLAANAKAEAKECADELLAALRTTVDECNNVTYDTRPKFLAMLEEQVGELDDWLAQYKPEEEPVEAETAEPADEPKADDAGVASNP